MIGLPSPWLILAAVLAVGAAGAAGELHGAKRGRDSVQVRWDAERLLQAEIAAENQRLVARASTNLQEGIDDDRKKNAVAIAGLDADVSRLTRELSNRPSRPADGKAAPGQAACPGPGVRTGLGLYREDGLFLVGEAATGKRIKLQRDQCYAAYERAQAEIERLTSAGPSSQPPGRP